MPGMYGLPTQVYSHYWQYNGFFHGDAGKNTCSNNMNNIQQRRLYYVILFSLGLAISAGFILYALKQNINVFLTPSQLTTTTLPTDYHFRLGGMVKNGSVVREKDGLG